MKVEIDKVYNCDCLDLMQSMIEQNIKVDCIVTDPPYLINYCRHEKENKFGNVIKNDDNPELIKDYIKLCYDIMKDNTAMFMFCSHKTVDYFKNELEKYFNIKNMIIWDKLQQGMGDTATIFGLQYEICFLVSKGKTKIIGKRYGDVWKFNKVNSKNQIHQNQKPEELISRCITSHSNKWDLVFDGFMGSFTTAVACHKLNRHYIGAELNKDYYKIGSERLETVKNQISMFD